MPRSWQHFSFVLLMLGCEASDPSAPDLGAPLDQRVPDSAPQPTIEPPQLVDWSCPEGWESESVAKGSEVKHTICVPPEQLTCPGALLRKRNQHLHRQVCPAGDPELLSRA